MVNSNVALISTNAVHLFKSNYAAIRGNSVSQYLNCAGYLKTEQ